MTWKVFKAHISQIEELKVTYDFDLELRFHFTLLFQEEQQETFVLNLNRWETRTLMLVFECVCIIVCYA